MRILLWHGYLLGGTGSNVYTRALAREWSRAGHEVVVVSQERAPEQYDLGGARTVAVDLPGGLLPTFVMDRYEGLDPKFLQDFTRGRAARVRRGERRCAAGAPPGRPRLHEPRADGRAGRAASGAPFRVKAHGSELEYSMRGRPELGEWARERSRGPRRPTSARSTSARCSQTSSGTSTTCSRCRRASTSTSSAPGPRRRACAPARRGAARPAERRRRTAARRRQRRAACGVPRRAGPLVVYFGKLIEQKGVQVLLEAMQGIDARLVVVGFGPYRARSRLPRRRGRSSPARSSTATWCTSCRSPT